MNDTEEIRLEIERERINGRKTERLQKKTLFIILNSQR